MQKKCWCCAQSASPLNFVIHCKALGLQPTVRLDGALRGPLCRICHLLCKRNLLQMGIGILNSYVHAIAWLVYYF